MNHNLIIITSKQELRLMPFLTWGNWGREKLSHLSKATTHYGSQTLNSGNHLWRLGHLTRLPHLYLWGLMGSCQTPRIAHSLLQTEDVLGAKEWWRWQESRGSYVLFFPPSFPLFLPRDGINVPLPPSPLTPYKHDCRAIWCSASYLQHLVQYGHIIGTYHCICWMNEWILSVL